MESAPKTKKKVGFVLLFIGIFTWSTIEITFKLIQNNILPLTANFLRIGLGGIVLLIYVLVSGKLKEFKIFIRRFPKYYIPGAVIGMVLGQYIYLKGTSLTEASYAATIFSSNPIIISILAIYFFKEKVTLKKVIGIIIGFLGVLIMITELNFSDFMSSENLIGNLMVFIGMSLWCVDLFLGKALINKQIATNGELTGHESTYFNTITFILAGIIMLPIILVTDTFEPLQFFTIKTWVGLFYLGIVTGGIGYVLFFKGLSYMEASKGINIFYLKPIIATILSIFLLQEIPTIFLYFGIGIEVIALFLVSSE